MARSSTICDLAVTAAVDSIGIAFVLEQHARAELEDASLKAVLTPFLPAFAGWSVCDPRTTRRSAAADAVINFFIKRPDRRARVEG